MSVNDAAATNNAVAAAGENVVSPVETHLRKLRTIAIRKLEGDPLPTGKEAEKRIRAEIREFDLEENIADLETKGYTVLPPGKAAPIEFTERLGDKMLQIAEAPSTTATGLSEGRTHFQNSTAGYRTMLHSVPRDPIYEEALLAPVPLAVLTYLLGYRAKLSSSSSNIRGRTEQGLMFHADHSTKIPPPWTVAQHTNITWVLSDYTRDNGALCVVPGSHRWGYNPPDDFVMAHDHEDVEAVEVPAGSVVVFHGSLWHGALPRKNDGERLSLALLLCRDHIQTQEAYWASATPEMLERNP